MNTPDRSDDHWTVKRLLDWTVAYFGRKGSASPRLETEVLLAHVLDCRRIELYTQYEEPVGPSDRGHFRDLVRRRAEGEPVAYLVGHREFYLLELAVDRNVLIPRPDTEALVVTALEVLRGLEDPRVADVGTGSGNLALALASQCPSAQVEATDLSDEALAVARANADRHGLTDRVSFHQGDLLEPVVDAEPFDVVVSNPPYIPTADIATLEPDVRDFEPHLALDGGPDGLDAIRRLIIQAIPRLKLHGHLLFEIGYDQEDAARALVESHAELALRPTVRDLERRPRVICCIKSNE